MIEAELGSMFKRIASMAECRYSDHAVGTAVMELVEAAATAIVERGIPKPLTEAERKDVESGIEWRSSVNAEHNNTESDNPPW